MINFREKNYLNGRRESYYKYVIEAILFFTYVIFGMTWAAAGSVLKEIMEELSLGISEASFINTSVTIAKILGPVVAGYLSMKLGLKRAFLTASILICTGILAPIAPNYLTLLLARFAMGVGGSLVVVYFTPIVMQWFSEDERPLINGMNFVSISIGMMFGLLITEPLMQIPGVTWKKVLMLYSSISILFAVLWFFFGREKGSATKRSRIAKKADASGFFEALKNLNTWKLAFTYSGLLSVYLVIITYFPTYYKTLPILSSNYLVAHAPAIAMFSSIPASFMGIVLSRKIGLRVPFVRFSGFFLIPGIMGMFMFHNVKLIVASAILTGITLFIFRPSFFTIPQELPGSTPEKSVNMMSVFWALAYVVGTFNTWIVGRIIESTGSFVSGFIYITLMGGSMFIGSFIIPETGKIPEDTEKQPPEKSVLTMEADGE